MQFQVSLLGDTVHGKKRLIYPRSQYREHHREKSPSTHSRFFPIMMDIRIGVVRGKIVRSSISISHSTRHWHQSRPLGYPSGLIYSSRLITAFSTRSAHSTVTPRAKGAQFACTTKSPNSARSAASDSTRTAGGCYNGLLICAFLSVHAKNMVCGVNRKVNCE